MICPNCSAEFDGNMRFCPACGTPVNVQNDYQNNNHYQQTDYQQNNPYSSMPYGTNMYPQPQPEKNPTVGQYVGWMLIGSLFGPISLVISIIFACSSQNKPRATFFKAHLILMAVGIGIAVIIGIALSSLMLMGFSEFPVESFGYYEELLAIASLVR